MVKNLEIHNTIFMDYFDSNIRIKPIELRIRFWRHFKANSKLFDLLLNNKYLSAKMIPSHIIDKNGKTNIVH